MEGQWVDITGVADGDYVLEIEANDTHLVTEANYDNNSAAVIVRIAGLTATVVGAP